MISRLTIVSEARKLIGVPFRHQGRNPVAGVDCAGVVWCTAASCNLPRDDVADYPANASTVDVEEILAELLDEVPVSEMREGDVITFRIPRCVTKHLAIKTDKGMIHAWQTAGRVIEHAMTKGWQSKVSKVFRWPQSF